ncbi:MAG: HD domain-containing protein [Candidatus Micrarchaeota archaeon]
MKTIRDAVHLSIEVSDAEVAVIDTPQMQRLRYVRQLALAYLVYPSAVHNRFEHSLGTMHLTDLASRRLFKEDDVRLLRLAGLLHDVGHSAFSHLSEAVVAEATGLDHEQLGRKKIEGTEISDALSAHGFSVRELVKAMQGPKEEIISNAFGTDRIDYLLRDAHFTGVSYSLVDAERLLQSFAFDGRGLALEEKGLLAAESLLVSRYLMFRAVYNHHANRIATAMLESALRIALEKRAISVPDLTEGNDCAVLFKLQEEPLVRRLLSRRLFKTAFTSPDASLSVALEEELSRDFQRDRFVVCRGGESLASPDVRLNLKDGTPSTLMKESFLAREVNGQLKAAGVLVACDAADKSKVAAACSRVA